MNHFIGKTTYDKLLCYSLVLGATSIDGSIYRSEPCFGASLAIGVLRAHSSNGDQFYSSVREQQTL